MAKPITIKITGDASGLKRALDGASDMVGKFGSAVTTAVKGGALAGAHSFLSHKVQSDSVSQPRNRGMEVAVHGTFMAHDVEK